MLPEQKVTDETLEPVFQYSSDLQCFLERVDNQARGFGAKEKHAKEIVEWLKEKLKDRVAEESVQHSPTP